MNSEVLEVTTEMTDKVNAMNDATRQQQAFHNHVTTKVKNHEALEDNEIKHLAPVAFKSEMTTQEIANLGLSNHYSFVPTMNVVKDLQTMGWDCVDAKQVKSRKKSTQGYQKHMMTFEHPKYKVEGVEEYPQLLLTNSHDGGNAFQLSAGIFRLVCSNGLVIKTEDYGSQRLIHKGYSFEAVQEMVEGFIATIDETMTRITAMKQKELNQEEMVEFAKQAALLRFTSKSYNEGNIDKVVYIDELLEATRKEDSGKRLWEVFNRVQERLVGGNYHYKGTKDKPRKARPIKNFKQNFTVNQKLSELAFAYV
tara:strand:- start:507 stop:1433 length:927 start_codon:yes stop_codon:yes gene_type:complete